MRLKRFCTACIVSVLALLFAGAGVQNCQAQGVSVAPLRVLFDGKTRSKTVFLSNRSPETANYRISLVNRRMLEDGSIAVAEVAEDGEYFADELIRYSPRRVTIPPYGSQTIRLLIRRPRGDFPENVEFRSHLSIRSVPAAPHLADLETEDKLVSEGMMSITAVPTIETVIPVIVRMGNPKVSIQLANPVLDLKPTKNNVPSMTIDILRSGDRSVYGKMTVVHIAPDGKKTQIHYAVGLAVYYPTSKRTRMLDFKEATPEMLEQGKLVVRYAETPDMHGTESTEITINLGKELEQGR